MIDEHGPGCQPLIDDEVDECRVYTGVRPLVRVLAGVRASFPIAYQRRNLLGRDSWTDQEALAETTSHGRELSLLISHFR